MVTYTPATKTLSITGGTWNNWKIKGGNKDSGDISGYKVRLENVVSSESYGKWLEVEGAFTNNGTATGNFVELVNSKVASVTGGVSYNSSATGNTVTLENSTVFRFVQGGSGVGDQITGNTLNLYGANTVGDMGVSEFQTINIKSAKWGTPALTLKGYKGIENNPTIDTRNISFTNLAALPVVGTSTTLIKNKMTGYTGEILSGKYTVGTTLEGTGTASISGSDLIYTVATGTEDNGGDNNSGPKAREQTHNTVMGAEVGMAALSVGNDFIGAATEGLSLAANTGADGIASFAQMGGASMRQETGSHVDVHTWTAILGLGHQNKKERGTFEYGAFFEYGTGNYTTHAENDLRGDGSARYTGGGLLAKYTMKNDVYVEGSLRAGSIHDDARNVMSDGAGNPYSYETNAPYWGAHIGVGKIIDLGSDHELDVYGKFYHNHRKGVSFNAGGHYDLDAVNSDVLRIGARYTLKREKWNFYGGVAYEHEFDGKANGTADGMAIRGADTSGASLRGELGVTFKPEKEGPLTLDFNVSGFAGKKRGVTGGVSVSLMF